MASLLRGAYAAIGPTINRPSMRVGDFTFHLRPGSGRTPPDLNPIFIGQVIQTISWRNALYFLLKMLRCWSPILENVIVIESNIGGRVPLRHIFNIFEEGALGTHLGADGDLNTSKYGGWWIEESFILFYSIGDMGGWKEYSTNADTAFRLSVGGLSNRKVAIIQKWINEGTKVKFREEYAPARVAREVARVCCTIPKSNHGSMADTVCIRFDKDIGGSSLDGRFGKGTCLVVPINQIEEVE